MNVNRLWKVGVSALVLILLVVWVNPAHLLANVHLVTLPVLAVMLGAVLLGQIINVLSQYWAVRPIKRIPFLKVLPYSMASWVSELFLPGKLGVFALAYFFQKEGVRLGESTSIILTLRLLNTGFALLLAFIGAGRFLNVPGVWSAIGGVLAIFFAAYILFFTARGRLFFRQRVLGRYAGHFAGFSEGLNKIKGNGGTMLGLFVLSGLYVMVQGLGTYWMFALSGYTLDLLTVMSAIALVQIAVQIPITINGWGIRESMMVLFFGQMGVPGEVTLLLSTVSISTAYVVALLVSWTAVREIPPKAEWLKQKMA